MRSKIIPDPVAGVPFSGDDGHDEDEETAVGGYFKGPDIEGQVGYLAELPRRQGYLPDLASAGSGGEEIEDLPVGGPAGVGVFVAFVRRKENADRAMEIGNVNGGAEAVGGWIGPGHRIGDPAAVRGNLGVADPFHGQQIRHGERMPFPRCRRRHPRRRAEKETEEEDYPEPK